jgi:steroid delta-isomerase-like uncharacterized protein
MTNHNPKSVVERWFDEVWNQGKEATIDELLAPAGVGHGLGEAEADTLSAADFKAFWRNMRAAIPDVKIHVEDMVMEGDRVAVRVILEGTHSGDGMGAKATGRPIRIAGIVIVRIVDGQMVECWNSWDQLGLMHQLGVLPRGAEPDRFLTD